jgi:hypothetical protein
MSAAVAVLVVLTGCTAQAPEPSAPTSPAPSANTAPAAPPPSTGPFNQQLHDELIAMLKRDQAVGSDVTESSQARTDRLREIILEHGWPTSGLVGEDGEDAAWAIAQHSDLDPAFQRFALEQLRAAVAIDQASPGNLAYLEDRVATAAGKPQIYGTQMRCGPDGAEPATSIEDEAGLEERWAAIGLPTTYAEYLAEMAAICAEVPEG